MMEYNVDEIMQWYDRLIETVRVLAMPAHEQVKKLYGTVVADEIALDFSDIGLIYAKKLFDCKWITQDQFEYAQNIDNQLEEMSKKSELWTETALSNSVDWEICREMGRAFLKMLE